MKLALRQMASFLLHYVKRLGLSSLILFMASCTTESKENPSSSKFSAVEHILLLEAEMGDIPEGDIKCGDSIYAMPPRAHASVHEYIAVFLLENRDKSSNLSSAERKKLFMCLQENLHKHVKNE